MVNGQGDERINSEPNHKGANRAVPRLTPPNGGNSIVTNHSPRIMGQEASGTPAAAPKKVGKYALSRRRRSQERYPDQGSSRAGGRSWRGLGARGFYHEGKKSTKRNEVMADGERGVGNGKWGMGEKDY